jgi:hypothetical protein
LILDAPPLATVFLGDNLVSWSSKRQHTMFHCSAEAVYHAVANAIGESTWFRQLLEELLWPLPQATVMSCDNVSTVNMSTNPAPHQRTKHIEIDLHFICDHVALGQVCVIHVPLSCQFADIFAKELVSPLFLDFWSNLNVH